MEERARPTTVQDTEEEGDRTRLHRQTTTQQGQRSLHMRRLRNRTLLLRHKIRQRQRMAQLLDRAGQGQDSRNTRPHLGNGQDRDRLQKLWRPSRTSLRRWTPADWNALLRKLSIPRLQKERHEIVDCSRSETPRL